MATLNRRPLANRPLPHNPNASPPKTSKNSCGTSKRARSPDLAPEASGNSQVAKRARCVTMPSTASGRENKERRAAEREQQKNEFKDKYRRAFPSWCFYFDNDNIDGSPAELEAKIRQLGGTIEDFFSGEITHLITNQPIPTGDVAADKENKLKGKPGTGRTGALLKSPIKLRGRGAEDVPPTFDLVAKANSFGMKIWTTAKLDSVLNRCIEPVAPANPGTRQTPSTNATTTGQRSLSRLLQSERIHGTSERDPSQKRHDFRYFSRSSRFILVEDLRQELATIAAHEYIVPKGRDDAKMPWPVLHCHPNSRGPFIPYDDREKRRWEKTQQMELEQAKKAEENTRFYRVQALKRKAEATLHAKRIGDLRRSVSMSNLHRRTALADAPHNVENDGENPDSANASGYLASGAGAAYMAASGNSVGITSTTGTTSATGYTSRNAHLPLALSGRMKQEVITSRKFPPVDKSQPDGKPVVMGPPPKIPERIPMLKKSRSTNTLKLPKREEGSKPGYCESCRTKFDDFKAHIAGRKHRKFAADDANFFQLDCVLARVKRRTRQEVQEEQRKRIECRKSYCTTIRAGSQEFLRYGPHDVGNYETLGSDAHDTNMAE